MGVLAARLVGIVLCACLAAPWQVADIGPVAKGLPLLLFAAGVYRFGAATIVFCALAPVAGLLAVWLDLPVPPTRLLEQFAVAAIAATLARLPAGGPDRLGAPAVALALVAMAGAAVVQPAWLLGAGLRLTAGEAFSQLWRGDYVATSLPWLPLHAALLIVEGAALAWSVERLTRAIPAAGRWIVAALVAGSAAAAGSNSVRLIQVAAERDRLNLDGVMALLASSRISTQLDVNASGSLFATVIVVGLFLPAAARSRLATWTAVGALIFVGVCGLWLSGSRAAIAAAFCGVVIGFVLRALAARRHQRRAAAGLLAAAVVGAALVWSYPASRNFKVSSSVESRLILYRAAVAMWRDAPAAGIGIGTFYDRSADYGVGAIDAIVRTGAQRENAHNYFLQLLAELGVVGLLAYLWILVAAVGRPWQPLTTWALAGAGTYLATSLTGHPQLLAQAVLPFWVVLGLLAGSTPAPSRSRHRVSWLSVGVVACGLAASAPKRLEVARDAASLEHVGLNMSAWQTSPDGRRYRIGATGSSTFLPTGHLIALPLRLAPGAVDRAQVSLRVEGRVANQVEVSVASWRELRLTMGASDRRFVEVTFELLPASAGLQVGKAVTWSLR